MRVLLANGHSDVRSALRLLLEEEGNVEVVGEVECASRLLEVAMVTEPDVVVLQWELPQGGWQERPGSCQHSLITTLRAKLPSLSIVVFSGWPDARRAALAAGASQFISMGDSPKELLTTLRAVGAGGTN